MRTYTTPIQSTEKIYTDYNQTCVDTCYALNNATNDFFILMPTYCLTQLLNSIASKSKTLNPKIIALICQSIHPLKIQMANESEQGRISHPTPMMMYIKTKETKTLERKSKIPPPLKPFQTKK